MEEAYERSKHAKRKKEDEKEKKTRHTEVSIAVRLRIPSAFLQETVAK